MSVDVTTLALAKSYTDQHSGGGVTPTIGDNGNWYLGNIDTGKPSRGERGEKGDPTDIQQVTGQSTTSVMSQKATTDEIDTLKNDLGTKIDKPSTNPEVGKILKVTAVNNDGTFVCEWADAPAVDDVRINGVSIVDENGVAEMPIADNKVFGVVRLLDWQTCGLWVYENTLRIAQPNNNAVELRLTTVALTPSKADIAVKMAMCDGKGEAWTDTERIAALLRMGCTVDDNGFVKWTAQEVSQ